MKVCLVTAFPPTQETPNSSGHQLARELQRADPDMEVTILAERLPGTASESDDFKVVRCWSPHSAWNVVRVIREVRQQHPDVVWFNVSFRGFFERPLARLLELSIPPVCRLFGYAWPILIL